MCQLDNLKVIFFFHRNLYRIPIAIAHPITEFNGELSSELCEKLNLTRCRQCIAARRIHFLSKSSHSSSSSSSSPSSSSTLSLSMPYSSSRRTDPLRVRASHRQEKVEEFANARREKIREREGEWERDGGCGGGMDPRSRSASFSDFPRDATGRLRHPYPPRSQRDIARVDEIGGYSRNARVLAKHDLFYRSLRAAGIIPGRSADSYLPCPYPFARTRARHPGV